MGEGQSRRDPWEGWAGRPLGLPKQSQVQVTVRWG